MKYEIMATELADADAAAAVVARFLGSASGRNPNFNYVFALRVLAVWESIPEPVRDPELSLQLADRAVELSSTPNADYLAVLARAYAVRGDLSQAVVFQRQAIDAATPEHKRPLTRTLLEYQNALQKVDRITAEAEGLLDD
jgi:hypothetical protein